MPDLELKDGRLDLWEGENWIHIGDRKAVQEFILNLQEQLKIMEEKK